MATHLFLVFSEATPGREAEYNSWYDSRHLPDVLQVPGFRAAQRFRLQPEPGAPADAPGKYMAIYEIETDDLDAAMAELQSRAGTPAMPMSEALNAAAIRTQIIHPITGRMTAQPVGA